VVVSEDESVGASAEGQGVVVRDIEGSEQPPPNRILSELLPKDMIAVVELDHDLVLGDLLQHRAHSEDGVTDSISRLVGVAGIVSGAVDHVGYALEDGGVDELDVGASIQTGDSTVPKREALFDLLEKLETIRIETLSHHSIDEVHELLAYHHGANVTAAQEDYGLPHANPLEDVSSGLDQDLWRGGDISLVVAEHAARADAHLVRQISMDHLTFREAEGFLYSVDESFQAPRRHPPPIRSVVLVLDKVKRSLRHIDIIHEFFSRRL
jgi:hypothetical protein